MVEEGSSERGSEGTIPSMMPSATLNAMSPELWTSEHIQTIVHLVREGLTKEQANTSIPVEDPQDEDF